MTSSAHPSAPSSPDAEAPLDASSLARALESLRSALEVLGTPAFQAAEQKWQDLLTAGAVQNFEFGYELGWKMLKRQLERELPSADQVDGLNFRDLVRMGHERGLIDEPPQWFRFRELRNVVSHTYDRRKAAQVVEGAADLMTALERLLQSLLRRGAVIHPSEPGP